MTSGGIAATISASGGNQRSGILDRRRDGRLRAAVFLARAAALDIATKDMALSGCFSAPAFWRSSKPLPEFGSLTAPAAERVADGVEVILGAQDQAIANEGRGGQRHLAEVVGIHQFVFIAGANPERSAFFVQTKYFVVVAP